MMGVVLISAINAKTIEVKFNKVVEDTSKATVELLRGTFKQNATVKWAEDAKSVQLVGAGNFQAGDYTVNVKGLTEEALTAEVKIEAVKVALIEILSEEAVLSENPNGFIPASSPITATVGYTVKDQYGTDITKTTTLTTNGNDVVADKGTVTISKLDGKKIGDLVPVVLIHADSATTVSKTLKLSAAATVSDVQVEGIYNTKGKEVELEDNTKAADVFLVLNLKDQYGQEIKPAGLGDTVPSVIVTNTNPLVTKISNAISVKSIDSKNRFVVTFEKVDENNEFKAGSAELLFIKTMDGKTFKHTVNVAETQTTDAVTVGKPEYAIAGENVLVPITVLDKEGNVITDKKLLTHPTKGIKVNTDNPAVSSKITVKDGQVYYNLGNEGAADEYKTVTVQTSTFKIGTVTYKVTAAAKPVAVRGFKNPLVITENKSVTLADVNVEDQYGRTMDTLADNYKVRVRTETNPIVKINPDKSTIEKIGPTGTATVVLYLEDSTINSEKNPLQEVKNSAVEQQVRVTDGKEYKSYEVKDLGLLQADKDGGNKLVVSGVLADGGKVELKGNEFVATTDLAGVTVTNGVLSKVTDADDAGIWLVDGKKVTERDVKVTFTINNDGKQVEHTYKLSNKAPVTQEFIFTTSTHIGTDADEIKAAKERKTAFELPGVVDLNKLGNVLVTDQYGNKEIKALKVAEGESAVGVLTIVPADASKVVISGNATNAATVKLAEGVEEAEVTARVKIGNATKEIKVKLTPVTP